jgi:hypothetical protein
MATALLNDTYYLDLNDPTNPRWCKMEIDDSNGHRPAVRWRHTATAITDNQMMVCFPLR